MTGSRREAGPTATPAARLLLAANFLLVTLLPFGLTEGMAVRISMLSAAVWWAGFTFIPFLGLRNRPPAHVVPESRLRVAQLRPAGARSRGCAGTRWR